jgi:hypothetical protein
MDICEEERERKTDGMELVYTSINAEKGGGCAPSKKEKKTGKIRTTPQPSLDSHSHSPPHPPPHSYSYSSYDPSPSLWLRKKPKQKLWPQLWEVLWRRVVSTYIENRQGDERRGDESEESEESRRREGAEKEEEEEVEGWIYMRPLARLSAQSAIYVDVSYMREKSG